MSVVCDVNGYEFDDFINCSVTVLTVLANNIPRTLITLIHGLWFVT